MAVAKAATAAWFTSSLASAFGKTTWVLKAGRPEGAVNAEVHATMAVKRRAINWKVFMVMVFFVLDMNDSIETQWNKR